MAFITAIGNALTSVLGWFGTVITSLIDSESGELYALLPVLAISCGIALVMVSIRLVRNLCWGA